MRSLQGDREIARGFRQPARTHANPEARTQISRRLAERCVAVTLAQSPAAIHEILDQFDVDQLSAETRALVEIVTEYPALCAAAGPASVAEKLECAEEVVRHFRWLELTPPAELNALPSLDESLKVFSPEPPLELLGALAQWRDELRRGIGGQRRENPSTWRHDALYTAACHETAAIEAERGGNRTLARQLIEKAAWAVAGEAASQRTAVA